MIARILTIAKTVWLEMLRKKDIYVLLILLTILLFVLLFAPVFGDMTGQSGFVKDLGLMLTWAFAWILVVVGTAPRTPPNHRLPCRRRPPSSASAARPVRSRPASGVKRAA